MRWESITIRANGSTSEAYMAICAECNRRQSRIEQLESEIAVLEDHARLLEIAREYADLMAESGSIPNTPAAKLKFITGGRYVSIAR
jgi:hypothetical protein